MCALPRDHVDFITFAITVAWRGSMFADRLDQCWAVVRAGKCLNRRGEWDYEPSPSSRTDRWIKGHRFTLEKALELARKAAPRVTVNGHTVESVR